MSHPIYNLHNHTPFSDGAYTMDELCEAHLACDTVEFDGVGISDHLFCTPSSREIRNERDFERTFAAETREYVEAVHAVRRRWADRLRVFCGCEINWPLNKHHLNSVRTLLNGIDYVLFEFVDWAGLTQLANQARRWPCPVGVSHTDVARQFPTTSMDQVVRTMANARIFYEINTGMLPLGNQERWFSILPNHRVAISLGTDTHDDLGCIRHVAELVRYAEQKGLDEKYLQLRLRADEPDPTPAAQGARSA
jgi:histidinol phosphatase-like PHP family hydrolase